MAKKAKKATGTRTMAIRVARGFHRAATAAAKWENETLGEFMARGIGLAIAASKKAKAGKKTQDAGAALARRTAASA